MYEIVSTRGRPSVQGPSEAPLSEYYSYLRLYFGRFLADVRVQPDNGQAQFDWLIPDGRGEPPPAARIQQELQALGWTLERASREINGDTGRKPSEAGLVRRTMASRVLAALRVPMTPSDVCFTRNGDLVVINWCMDSPVPGLHLGDCDARGVVKRLADGLRVEPPAVQPVPKPAPGSGAPPRSPAGRVRQEVQAGAEAGAAEPVSEEEPARPVPKWFWKVGEGEGEERPPGAWEFGRLMLYAFLLIAGLFAGAILGFVVHARLAPTPKQGAKPVAKQENGKLSTPSPSPSGFEPAKDLDLGSARALVLPERLARGSDPTHDWVTVWLPLKENSGAAKKAKEFETYITITSDAKPGPTRWWLVYAETYPTGVIHYSAALTLKELSRKGSIQDPKGVFVELAPR